MTGDMLAATVRWRNLGLAAMLVAAPLVSRAQDIERNKAIARQFYESVWFSPNTEAVHDLVAADYIIHDVGGLDGVREPASAQKDIADFFWANGTMRGTIDYQVADGDLVATRWQWDYAPHAWWMKVLMAGGRRPIPVINVFRIQDGKIVEIWNHRHDIDVGFRANVLRTTGFIAGLLVAAVLTFGRRWWRRRGERRAAAGAA
jgi:predicted SnoaL-like aldol condensation-catalyzing enzyme